MNHSKKAKRAIERLLNEGKRKFIIYPYGVMGKFVKDYLAEVYGISDIVLVDNHLCKYNDAILPLDKIADFDLSEYAILLTSIDRKTYSDIRYNLMKYVKINQFVDVFNPSMYFDPDMYYDKPTYGTSPRLIALEACAKEIYKNGVAGKIAECGVYKGWFADFMTRFMPDREIYLFDTFKGFDARDIDDVEEQYSAKFRKKTNLDDTTVELALNELGYRTNAIVKQGYFPDTAVGLENEKFAFVSLDTDLYKPIYAGLEFFYPRLTPGGYIFVDDLGHSELTGVRQAVVDYCNKEHIGYVPVFDGTDETAIIVKNM